MDVYIMDQRSQRPQAKLRQQKKQICHKCLIGALLTHREDGVCSVNQPLFNYSWQSHLVWKNTNYASRGVTLSYQARMAYPVNMPIILKSEYPFSNCE